ncbi:MAG: hypothetical protein KDD60_02835, partial [Bdellovibrionales bacterium]|nr:hypothetical protein [Bdellovibrionales bacterium]
MESRSQEYPIAVTTFYCFSPLEPAELERWEEQMCDLHRGSDLLGLVITAVEGINGTVSGSDSTIVEWKQLVRSMPGFEEIIFKDSRARVTPFKRFKIKRRREIVTLGRPDILPKEKRHNHLSPAEWDRTLKEEEVVVIDTRNSYEVDLGKFRGAIDPKTKYFSEFGDFVESSGIPKDQKVLMYCTGGIRCEKAIYEMELRGYENVFQLEGGILNYLQHFPNSEFEGECFVFDHRVSV